MMQPSIGTAFTYRIDDDQTASEAVLDAVAERAGVGVLDISTPLYEAVDPEALDAFYRTSEPSDGGETRVSFEYYGYGVTVSGDGEVRLDAVTVGDGDADQVLG
ncbi:HalOD1 output domain-containing protein [Halosimplex halophilum]|uniref:HalOD1 output domain-containing protein n=1 Tax=Halosimplex halophilum TaxID=2559572 RepID=UPI001AE47357|nr:HalOD1 output domain-containing protein [Halosimplex halophilum]